MIDKLLGIEFCIFTGIKLGIFSLSIFAEKFTVI